MLSGIGVDKVHLACGNTDMRASIDGLVATIQRVFKLDPFSSALFVFCNRKRDRLKMILWDHNGFWLFYRRLEEGKFIFPEKGETKTVAIEKRQLEWLLSGLSIEQKQAHKKVTANIVI